MLVEEGFDVVSVDASDKMLKYALKSRWERRKEPAFDQWGTRCCCFFISSLIRQLMLTPVGSGGRPSARRVPVSPACGTF